ncbi:MAG TPA: hypothetical protein VG713_01665, partial [Pirellulales bacterium]|nr:hypothetical protein [Pirellulales bacterium]
KIHDMISSVRTDYVMDPILTLFGPTGQIIAQNDNYYGGDSLLAVKLPADGAYVLEVRDCRYNGHDKFTYCVEVAKRAFAETVFPLAVQRGKTLEAEPIGPFCNAKEKIRWLAAADAALGTHDLRLATSRGELNPVSVLVCDEPQIIAPTTNHALGAAAKLSFPVGVNGRFAKPDETHYYAFDARKDAWYDFELYAHRQGLPLDAVFEMYDAKGARVKVLDALGKAADEIDDVALYGDEIPQDKDPRFNFHAPADGRYVLAVRDAHGRGGADFVYHLRAAQGAPDFELTGQYYLGMLAPGLHTVWFARVHRRNGFEGPVAIHVDGLPKGVTQEPVTIPAGMTDCSIILAAAADAPMNATLVNVVGRSEATDRAGKPITIERSGRTVCELQGEGGGQYMRTCQTKVLGVAKQLDLAEIVATPGELTLRPGQKSEITVKVRRQPGFTEPVNLDVQYIYPGAPTTAARRGTQLPPGVALGKASKLQLTEKGQVLEGKVVIEVAADAKPIERRPIAVLAGVNISFSVNTVYGSNPIYLTVAPAAKSTQTAAVRGP